MSREKISGDYSPISRPGASLMINSPESLVARGPLSTDESPARALCGCVMCRPTQTMASLYREDEANAIPTTGGRSVPESRFTSRATSKATSTHRNASIMRLYGGAMPWFALTVERILSDWITSVTASLIRRFRLIHHCQPPEGWLAEQGWSARETE